jgi:hypothetical protein
MRWALDYAAQQSSGIVAWRRDTDHIEKAFVFAGMTARNGVTSALVVPELAQHRRTRHANRIRNLFRGHGRAA